MRRAFRFGLSMGLLVGVVFAVAKLVQSRRGSSGDANGWRADAERWVPQGGAGQGRAEAGNAVISEPDAVMLDPEPGDATRREDDNAPPAKPKATPRPRTPTKKAPARKSASAGPTSARRKPAARADLWVESSGGECPASHPVKAKLTSRIFHMPGMLAYSRTRADRCYSDEAAAVGDGFVKAKR